MLTVSQPSAAELVAAAHRRLALELAGPAIASARSLYSSAFSPALRAAVLVEIAGAAAALARRTVLVDHVDTRSVLVQVTDPADVRAVLGRGAWLPTMVRPVAAPARAAGPVSRRVIAGVQLDLFTAPAGGDR